MTSWCVPDSTALAELRRVEETFVNPVDYYLDASGAKDESYRLETEDGLRVELRPETDRSVPDREVVREVLVEGVYDFPELALPDDATVFDIGGHVGTFSLWCADRTEDGRIVVCEPHPDNYEQLLGNVRRNGFDNVYPNNAACTADGGSVELSPSTDNTGGHSTVYDTPGDDTVEVPAVTVRELMDEYDVSSIDLLKLDAEGAEYDVLFGLPDETFESVDRIVLEEHRVPETERRYDDDDLRSHLELHGYDVTKTNEVEYPDEGRFWILCATRS